MNDVRVDLLAEAQLEIDEAFDWYLHRSVRAAEAFLHELEHGFAFIASNPSACPRSRLAHVG